MSLYFYSDQIEEDNFKFNYINDIFSKEIDKKCILTNNDYYDLIYSISDIHGDYQAFHNIITHLKDKQGNNIILYDETNKYYWNPEVSNVCIIQTGDIIDGYRSFLKNPPSEYIENYRNDDLKIIDIMITLKESADSNLDKNNKIILLYGNHEIENIFSIINIQELNYNNYLLSDKSKLSEIDFCTFDINPEEYKLKNSLTNEDEFNRYKICESIFGRYSINYKNVDRFDISDENIHNYEYNKQIIIERLTYFNKLKDKILCNYQTYAIVNSYLFCHSGFIYKFIKNLINIYNQFKTKKESNISLEEFINNSIKNNNQNFINIVNKIFTKIINFLWNIYNDVNKDIIINPKFKEEIKYYKNLVNNIIWSENFRNLYLKKLQDFNKSSKISISDEDILNFKYVNDQINFILHKLHLKGIIMGHIADNNVRQISVINELNDFYIYLTDIAISRIFYTMNRLSMYEYNKYYVILQINRNGDIEYVKIPNDFSSKNIIDKEYDKDIIKYNYSDMVNRSINIDNLTNLLIQYINQNDLLINNNLKEIYINNKLPEEIISYLKNYIHIDISTNLQLNSKLIESLKIIINKILLQKLKDYINNSITNIFDLCWIFYILSNKEKLTSIDSLLKLYLNAGIEKETFIQFYNNNSSLINSNIKNLVRDNICIIMQNSFEKYLLELDKNQYNVLLIILILKLTKNDYYDEFLYTNIIKKIFNITNQQEYYTKNFKLDKEKKDRKKEKIEYLMSIITLFKQNINIYFNNNNIDLQQVISIICEKFINENIKKIVDYAKINGIKQINIQVLKRLLVNVMNIEEISFDIKEYLINEYNIEEKVLNNKTIKREIINLLKSKLIKYNFTLIQTIPSLLMNGILTI